jgi:hypothetical protein
MPLPPPDVPADELWLKLSEPKPSEVIDFPRKDGGKPIGRIRIQVLSMEDHNRARLSAQNELRKSAALVGLTKLEANDMLSPAVQEVLGDLTAHELLAMACLREAAFIGPGTDPDRPTYPRLFREANELRAKLTSQETLVLFNAYLLVQEKYGPFENGAFTDEEVSAWVRRLEEGADSFPLLQLSLHRLAQLALLLADRVSSLSRTLASQWGSLPSTLRSDLERFSIHTSFSGKLPDEEISTSSVSFEVTTELAADVAAQQIARRTEE